MRYISLFLLAVALCAYDLPAGWFRAGSKPADYEMGTDPGAGMNKSNAATIKSIKKKIDGFGTLMQTFSADRYKGKRIRLSGYMKADGVDGTAGFWLRVDGKGNEGSLSFDNMYDRPIKGTADWTKCEIVLDVPEQSAQIAYGALLAGTGQIWFDGLNFEEVPKTVPTTDGKNKEPENLNFEK